jgi:hypothetical protein
LVVHDGRVYFIDFVTAENWKQYDNPAYTSTPIHGIDPFVADELFESFNQVRNGTDHQFKPIWDFWSLGYTLMALTMDVSEFGLFKQDRANVAETATQHPNAVRRVGAKIIQILKKFPDTIILDADLKDALMELW